jgi:ATP-binding cassette subfamily F protein uup
VVVSHDRYFLDRTVDHIFRFEGNGVLRQYPGNYSAFLETRQKEERESAAVKPKTKTRYPKPETSQAPTVKQKLSFKERNELDALEIRIQEAERRQAEIETELAANSSDAHLVHKLFKERETLMAQLARDLDRWSELAELA